MLFTYLGGNGLSSESASDGVDGDSFSCSLNLTGVRAFTGVDRPFNLDALLNVESANETDLGVVG